MDIFHHGIDLLRNFRAVVCLSAPVADECRDIPDDDDLIPYSRHELGLSFLQGSFTERAPLWDHFFFLLVRTIDPMLIIRHVGSDDPEMIAADPEYYMIHVITIEPSTSSEGQGSSSEYTSMISPTLSAERRSSVEIFLSNILTRAWCEMMTESRFTNSTISS